MRDALSELPRYPNPPTRTPTPIHRLRTAALLRFARPKTRRGIALALGQLGIVGAGVFFGSFVAHPGDPPHVFTFLAGLSLVLLALGTVGTVRTEPASVRWAMLGGTLGQGLYHCFVMLAEPFLGAPTDLFEVFIRIAWLVPLLLAGLLFARFRCWFQATATAVFLFACVSLLTFNLHWLDPAGFLTIVRR